MGVQIDMKKEFIFIQKNHSEIFNNICMAIDSIFSTPDVCLYKIRKITEHVVQLILQNESIIIPSDCSLYEGLLFLEKQQCIAPNILSNLHEIRTLGNKGVHTTEIKPNEAQRCIFLLYKVFCWYVTKYEGSTIQEVSEEEFQIKYYYSIDEKDKSFFDCMMRSFFDLTIDIILKEKLDGWGSIIEIEYMSFQDYYKYFTKALEIGANYSNEEHEISPADSLQAILKLKAITKQFLYTNDDLKINKELALMLYLQTHWVK